MLTKTKMISRTALAAVISLGLSGCGGGGGPTITQVWYDVFGSVCGYNNPGPGCNFYSNGDKIEYYQDPYVASLQYYHNFWVPGYGWFSGYGRYSNTGIFYDEYGYALNSKQKQSRDLIATAAATQKAIVKGAAKHLEEKFGLNAQASLSIATTLNEWALIGKSRKRTQADVEAFTKRLTGLKLKEVNAALAAAQKGDIDGLDQAVAQAAQHWSTSPETMKQILKSWYQGQN